MALNTPTQNSSARPSSFFDIQNSFLTRIPNALSWGFIGGLSASYAGATISSIIFGTLHGVDYESVDKGLDFALKSWKDSAQYGFIAASVTSFAFGMGSTAQKLRHETDEKTRLNMFKEAGLTIMTGTLCASLFGAGIPYMEQAKENQDKIIQEKTLVQETKMPAKLPSKNTYILQ